MESAAAVQREIDLASEPQFRVGGASVDPVSREVSFESGSERLQPQNLKVLIALARRRGHVISRDELIELCWGGRVVGDDVIHRAISTLRHFAKRAGGFEIETVPRVGYRLVDRPKRRPPLLWPWLVVSGAVALSLLMAVGLWIVHSRNVPSSRAPTIAVLPFTAASDDPKARELASAAHDAVTHSLSQTQFAIAPLQSSITPGAGADFIVSADAETAADGAVVSLRIVQSADGLIVYSQRFEASRSEASSLPERIAGQVAGSVGWTAPILAGDRQRPSDPAILAQVFHYGVGSSAERTLRDFQSAQALTQKDPDSPLAQFQLALDAATAQFDVPREQRPEVVRAGRAAAERALVLAPDLGESQIPWCLLHNKYAGRVECENRLRAGLAADPQSPWVDYHLADALKDAGRFTEALDLSNRSLARDPYAQMKIALELRMLEATGAPDGAEALFQQSQRWWPDSPEIFWDRAYGMADRGDLAAIARFADAAGSGMQVTGRDLVGELPEAMSKHDLALAKKMCPLSLTPSPRLDFCVVGLAMLGDADDAIALAQVQYPDRIGRSPADSERFFLDDPWFTDTDALTGPATASLRRDPRFLAIAEHSGLLAYWRSGRLPDFCRGPRPEPICRLLSKH